MTVDDFAKSLFLAVASFEGGLGLHFPAYSFPGVYLKRN